MPVTTQAPFLQALLDVPQRSSFPSTRIDRLRASALERANALSVPTTRDEDWRFTDLSAMTRITFQPAAGAGPLDAADLSRLLFPEAAARLVFVDGVYAPQLSVTRVDAGVRVIDLRSGLLEHRDAIEPLVGSVVDGDANLFAALNTAFMRDSACIVLDADRSLAAPVHVLHVATDRESSHAMYPRTLIAAGRHASATIVEEFVALGERGYLSAPVAEVVTAEEASLDHIRLQCESSAAYHIANCAVSQARASRYRAISIALGARLSRLDLTVKHAGPGCETAIDGLALIGGRQLADTHSTVYHDFPAGRLRQAHKCVAGGAAHAVFNGKIYVREGAQQTDAAQSCRGLLLSDRAQLDVKPQLEIFADDVKCAHGAAIGQLDPDELFYLRSRGLAGTQARNLLTYAFAAEIIERIPVRSLVERLQKNVLERTQEAS